MARFDLRDFTKSALSLAGGMCLVIGLVFWHSNGDTTAIWLTAGLPTGVLSFWAIYFVKVRTSERSEAFIDEGTSLGNSSALTAYQRPRGRSDSRTLKPGRSDEPAKARVIEIRQEPAPIVEQAELASEMNPSHGA